MHNHFSPDSEDSVSSPELDEIISRERTRTASIANNKSSGVHIPQLLNARASMIIPSGGRSPAASPSTSPRARMPSTMTQNNRQPGISSQQQQYDGALLSSSSNTRSERVSLESEQEKEKELRAYFESLVVKQHEEIREMEDKADKQRKFISDTLKGRVMGQKRSVMGIFDQSDDSETNEPFCVTVPSTPCDTPPPERVLNERTTHTQISKMYDMLTKISTRISALETNIARINNERFVDSQRRLEEDEETNSDWCSSCCTIS
jgi:hypothetical protein